MSFKSMIENRRKNANQLPLAEKRLTLIETEAMLIAHRELENARQVAEAFFPLRKLTMEDLLKLQSTLAGLYGLAYHELVAQGLLDRPVVTTPPELPPGATVGGN